MKIIGNAISLIELKALAKTRFGNLIKAVVDIEKEIMAIDADLHADEEAALLNAGSLQNNLWGINIYPDIEGPDWIEFDSMINLRPSQKNHTRGIDDIKVQQKIITIVGNLIQK